MGEARRKKNKRKNNWPGEAKRRLGTESPLHAGPGTPHAHTHKHTHTHLGVKGVGQGCGAYKWFGGTRACLPPRATRRWEGASAAGQGPCLK